MKTSESLRKFERKHARKTRHGVFVYGRVLKEGTCIRSAPHLRARWREFLTATHTTHTNRDTVMDMGEWLGQMMAGREGGRRD